EITQPNQSQTGKTGIGANGDCTGGGPCAQGTGAGAGGGVTATPAPVQVARVRRCVGDPPRQIEDPQSPPCVPYWQGDNGGATSKGVTADEIRIAVPKMTDTDAQFAAFFNSRFEFYGRKLHLLNWD